MKDKKIKQKILNSLDGKLEVTEVKRCDDDDISLICEFIKNGKNGSFRYILTGKDYGVDGVRDYEEEQNEDIYGDICDWVDEHIEWEMSVKLDGKEI